MLKRRELHLSVVEVDNFLCSQEQSNEVSSEILGSFFTCVLFVHVFFIFLRIVAFLLFSPLLIL